jgi:hypothetical protein
MEINIEWCDPYKVKIGVVDYWRREWIIPEELRSEFFSFWREEKFNFLPQGFRVYKDGNDWVLSETKLYSSEFSKIGTTKKIDLKLSNFILPSYKLKDTSGLRPWQISAAEKLVSSINNWGGAVDGSDTGCHTIGTLIRLYDGNSKRVEEIQPCEVLMGDDSTPRTVISTIKGNGKLYLITPEKHGDSFGVNEDHILVLYNIKNKEIVEISVKNYLEYSNNFLEFKDEHFLIRTSIQYPNFDLIDLNSFSLDPYRIGSWMGLLAFTTSTSSEKIKIHKSPYLNFISLEYFKLDFNRRNLILAGILDVIGNKVENGKYELFTNNDFYKDKVVELARSLGYGVDSSLFGIGWKITINGGYKIPCKVSKKVSVGIEEEFKSALLSKFEIKYIGIGNFYGFELDGNKRYLLNDFTITHNTGKTYTACAVARELGCKILIVCPKAVISSWKKIIKEHFNLENKLIDVINYEKLRIGKSSSNIASFVVPKNAKRKQFKWKIPKNTLIIWDESHKLKNWKTKNSKTCIEAYNQGYKQIFLSATTAHTPLELRTIGTCIKLIPPSSIGWNRWVSEHGCSRGNWGWEFFPPKKIKEKILKKINKDIFIDRGIRLKRDLIPNFPECDLFSVLLNMDSSDVNKINEIYSKMEKELEELKKSKELNEGNRLLVELKHRQCIELIKVPLYVEMVEEATENGFSVVVFVNFTDTVNTLAERLGSKCIYDGKTLDGVRETNKENFQKNIENKIIISIQSGGGGLSLHDIYGGHPRLALISPSHSIVNMKQVIGRIWRDDAKTKAIQKLICVADTIEESIYNNIVHKMNNLDLINDGDLSYSKKYSLLKI